MPLNPDASRQLLDYHERTKHHLHRFARSAGYMDWDNQPAPFRTYAGARSLALPLTSPEPTLDYAELFEPVSNTPAPMRFDTLGTLFEFSLALSAWKAIPGQRWALRINPSSGNLHPTEAHVITLGLAGLSDGIYHYHPYAHALEERAVIPPSRTHVLERHVRPPCLLVALSTIFWREAWKYGERAFRYCQHDIGHALAALGLASRLLGWRLTVLPAADDDIGAAFGFDRTPWPPGEAEAPALVAAIRPASGDTARRSFPSEAAAALADLPILGRPNPLSALRRDWDIIGIAAAASRQDRVPESAALPAHSPAVHYPAPATEKAARIIRQRRSAQAFDPDGQLERAAFLGLLDRTRPRSSRPPFDAGLGPAHISLVLFVHRVRQTPPGLYAFVRHPDHLESLRGALSSTFRWEPAAPGLPLYLLEPGDLRAEAMDLSCRQEIAGWGTFALGMLARFAPIVQERPWAYRQLFWEAGLIGQVLYLEAEAQGVRGTGIGCYFDDPVHDRLGLKNQDWQSLYHFTIGVPLEDRRLQTLPPYFHLAPQREGSDENA